MSNIKKYKVTYDLFDLYVEIDHEVMTDEKLHEINNFWGNATYRFKSQNKGDITATVLKLLASEVFRQSVTSWNPIDQFEWGKGKGIEGWPSMDGSDGIKITHVDELFFDADEMTIEIVD
ncbi:DUF2528 family protein [Undibacterium rugosum]|uniref:DUF2528 family protein n=1 Tax=Undibacterium rugosum TaxID=2762291 RepID=UPI001B821A94|nr:DUF2528 family protein [Undibacterium rugosum]MBR7777400.1 DUF2528 family protein [Undibacterium rugosum]